MLKIVFLGFLALCLADEAQLNEKCALNLTNNIFGIFKDQSFVCIGVLAHSDSTTDYIITAAHCLYRVQTSRLSVLLGKTIYNETATPVQQVFIHSYYSPPVPEFDIAVMKIKKSATSSVMKISKTPPLPENQVSVVKRSSELLDTLTLLPVKLEDRVSCRTKLSKYFYVSQKMLCGYYQPEGVLDGGPLLNENNIFGIISYRVKNDNGTLPVVFTNTANSDIYSFIEKILPLQM